MNNITIRQLRYFEAVAAAGHFGHAAAACSISQPAISVQIKELEAHLGSTLFERSARKIRLTGFGRDFAVRARQILQAVDDLSDLARASQKGLVGSLRLGIIPTIAPYLLPRIVKTLSISHAEIDLRIRESLTDKLITELRDGRLDAAIVALPISEPGLVEVELFEEEFVLVRSNADKGKPVPTGEELSEMKLLLLEEGHCFRDQALAFCGMRPPLGRDVMDGSSLSTLVQMVGSGIGVTLIPDMAVSVETRSAGVAVSRFSKPGPSRKIGVVWRKSNPLSEKLQQVTDIVRQSAEAQRREQGF